MSDQVIYQLVKIANDKRPELFNALRTYKQAGPAEAPSMMDKAKDMGNSALAAGKDYAPSIGYGAAGGAIAGIPIALLANALMGKDKSLRGSLRSALMGSLIGGGLGAAGGAGAKAMYNNGYKDQMNSGIDSMSGLAGQGADLLGLGGYNTILGNMPEGQAGPGAPVGTRTGNMGNALKSILGNK